MNNLLKETIEDIKLSGHTIQDIIFIGSEDSGICCDWASYETIADIEYENGLGAQKIATDLIIVFSDGTKMWRHEHDWDEHWVYSMPFKMPEDTRPMQLVTTGGVWEDLEDMHKPRPE